MEKERLIFFTNKYKLKNLLVRFGLMDLLYPEQHALAWTELKMQALDWEPVPNKQ